MSNAPSNAPDALLLISPGCPYCKQVLNHLSELVKNAEIGRLEIINIGVRPEAAQAVGARSAPWIRIGPFELTGNYSLGELREWAIKAAQPDTGADYVEELLREQKLDQAISYVKAHPHVLEPLLDLSQAENTGFSVRLGISALLESLQGTELLRDIIPRLGTMTTSDNPAVRADAAHYLGLTQSPDAIPWIKALLTDDQRDTREIAAESLQRLTGET